MNPNCSSSARFVSLSTFTRFTRTARAALAVMALATAACSATTATPARFASASAVSGPSMWDKPVTDARLEASNDVDRSIATRPIHAHVRALAY